MDIKGQANKKTQYETELLNLKYKTEITYVYLSVLRTLQNSITVNSSDLKFAHIICTHLWHF